MKDPYITRWYSFGYTIGAIVLFVAATLILGSWGAQDDHWNEYFLFFFFWLLITFLFWLPSSSPYERFMISISYSIFCITLFSALYINLTHDEKNLNLLVMGISCLGICFFYGRRKLKQRRKKWLKWLKISTAIPLSFLAGFFMTFKGIAELSHMETIAEAFYLMSNSFYDDDDAMFTLILILCGAFLLFHLIENFHKPWPFPVENKGMEHLIEQIKGENDV